MSDSSIKLPAPTVTADPNVMKLVGHAVDAECYRMLVFLLKEQEMLEQSLVRVRRSRSKDAAMQAIALDAQVSELKLLISQFINSK